MTYDEDFRTLATCLTNIEAALSPGSSHHRAFNDLFQGNDLIVLMQRGEKPVNLLLPVA